MEIRGAIQSLGLVVSDLVNTSSATRASRKRRGVNLGVCCCRGTHMEFKDTMQRDRCWSGIVGEVRRLMALPPPSLPPSPPLPPPRSNNDATDGRTDGHADRLLMRDCSRVRIEVQRGKAWKCANWSSLSGQSCVAIRDMTTALGRSVCSTNVGVPSTRRFNSQWNRGEGRAETDRILVLPSRRGSVSRGARRTCEELLR